MFGTTARRSASKGRSSSRKRSKSRKRSPRRADEFTKGYSCTLYQDYLVLYGGEYRGQGISEAFLYNLKEQKLERNSEQYGRTPYPRIFHSACANEKQNSIIIYGGDLEMESNKRTGESDNPRVMIYSNRDGLEWIVDNGLFGPFMPSPVSNLYEDKLYLYQADYINNNFGHVYIHDMVASRWQKLAAAHGDMELHFPADDTAIFCDNNLYLFTERIDKTPRKRAIGSRFFDDVYVLDLVDNDKNPRWRRVCPGGQAPGLLTDFSMAGADGIIYVFGSNVLQRDENGAQKTGLWTYNIEGERWDEVKNIADKLTVRPHQRAVIYQEQLLIVNWSYPNQCIDIQYLNLDNLGIAVPSLIKKKICKDQPESMIQDAKNLFNGKLFADVTFEVDGEEIPAHKAILAYRCNYFMKMFTSGMSESHEAKISILHMKSHIFKAILHYIYCNEVELDEQLALDLIPVVDEYLMKGLKGLCERYLCKQLRKDNVVDMLIVADRHEIEDLKKACFRFILKNLGNIDENEEMMKLSKLLFIELLKFNTSSGPQNGGVKREREEEEEKSNASYGFGYSGKASTSKSGYSSHTNGFGFGGQSMSKRSASKSRSPKRSVSKKRSSSKTR